MVSTFCFQDFYGSSVEIYRSHLIFPFALQKPRTQATAGLSLVFGV